MKNIHVGVLGAGLIAQEHLATLTRSPMVGSISVHDTDTKRCDALCSQYGAAPVSSLQALVDTCDLLWICTPPVAHREAVAAACKAGKAVFCEKPLAHTIADAKAIRQMVSKSGVPFFMGQSGRYTPAFVKIKQMVDQGLIGDVIYAWSTRHGYLNPKVTPAWRMDDKLSGGVIVEFGIHEIDFVQWVAGRLVEVSAVSTSKVINPGKFTEAVTAIGTCESGAKAKIEVSWANPRYLWQRGVEGTKGSLFYNDSDFNNVELHVPGKKPKTINAGNLPWKNMETGENLTFKYQAKAVLESLTKSKQSTVGLEVGLSAIQAAQSIIKAAASGKTTAVPK